LGAFIGALARRCCPRALQGVNGATAIDTSGAIWNGSAPAAKAAAMAVRDHSMHYEVEIDTVINGSALRRRVKVRQHLADFLREQLELTGTHLGCEHGVCGACSVLVDGKVVRGCLMLAVQAHGKRIDTIEGMSDEGALAELQAAFAARNAAQCGFCSPGMLLTAHGLVETGASFSRADIREFISGNLCRCTGYESIVDAIETVLRQRQAASGATPAGRS
jgi:aerobic carbon-monoxide dehydrogenase small subunit